VEGVECRAEVGDQLYVFCGYLSPNVDKVLRKLINILHSDGRSNEHPPDSGGGSDDDQNAEAHRGHARRAVLVRLLLVPQRPRHATPDTLLLSGTSGVTLPAPEPESDRREQRVLRRISRDVPPLPMTQNTEIFPAQM